MHKNVSYWEQNIFISNIDFAVIGSGIVGLNAAITRKKKYPQEKVVVIERGSLPSGASTKNAGFACFGSISELVEDMELTKNMEDMNYFMSIQKIILNIKHIFLSLMIV